MSTLVLLNPAASQARKNLTQVRAALADSSAFSEAVVEAYETWDEGCRAAADAGKDGYEMVVAAGGDGTVNSVVTGLMEGASPAPLLGVLPLGTGNDLARSLGIPADLADGIAALERGTAFRMDVLEVEIDGRHRFCANVSAGGFSGKVDEDLKDEDKRRWGPLAYLKTALEQVGQVKTYELVLSDDRDRNHDISAVNVVVANGRWAAGGIPVAPEASMDDGLMDVVVLSSGSVARLGAVAARMTAGRHLDHELVTTFRCRSLRIEADPAMPFNVDGELVGAGDARFEIIPGALRVLAGPDR